MNFHGRTEELREMREALSRQGYRGIMVYGRRHVGKSSLIGEAVKNMPGLVIYCQCVKSGDKENIASLYHAYQEASGDDLLVEFPSLDALLSYIVSRQKEQVTIVLDEYPYWRAGSENGEKGLDSILQKGIDRILTPAGAKLILSGSYLSVMDEIRKESGPLGGRCKTQIYLQPMDYYDASLFYPNYSPKDKMAAYAAFGGLPYVLQSIDPMKSVTKNIEKLYFDPSGELRKLVPLLVEEEIGKSDALHMIFDFLANTEKRPSLRDVCDKFQSRFSDEWVRVNLVKLESMKIVKRIAPIGSRTSDKNTYYRISDNAFSFYYRYVAPSETAILLGSGKAAYAKRSTQIDSNYVPSIFEDASREFLVRMNMKGLIDPPIEDLGTYFYNLGGNSNGQFDLVTKDEKGYVFYECKFRALERKDLVEEQNQVKAMPQFAIRPYKLAFIGCEKGELRDSDEATVYSLDDFFSPYLGSDESE